MAVTSFEEQNVFSVASNSTVSKLVFNSTNRELTFIVTGPSGSVGYANIYLAKTLVNDVAGVKGCPNGEPADYTATSLDDMHAYLLS